MKRKMLCLISFVFIIMLFSFVVNSRFFANTNIDYSNFSQFINVAKNGTYDREITITTINKTDNYNVPIELAGMYGETCSTNSNSKYKKKSGYGFKINGEFYTESVTLKESGFYRIEPCFYSITNGIAIPTSNSLEQNNIKIDIDLKLELQKKVFYYESYAFYEELLNDITSSFNFNNILLSTKTKTILKDMYNNFLNTRNSNPNNYNGDLLNGQVLLTFENYQSSEFVIDLKSSRSSEIEKIENWNEIIKEVKPIVIDVVKFQNHIGKEITAVPLLYNEILNLNLTIPEGHVLDLKCNFGENVLTIPFVGTSKYLDFIITYKLTDKNFENSSYSFTRKIIFYNSNLVSDTDKPEFYFSENLKIKQGDSDFDFNSLIVDAYDIVYLDFEKYHSYSNLNSDISVDYSKVDFTTPGNYEVVYTINDFKGNSTFKTITVEIVDKYGPKILTKYNKMYIDKNTKEFKDQILIIDNDGVDHSKTKYTFVEENENGGYIIIYAEDFQSNSTEIIINFKYQQELNLFQKIFVYPLYKIKEFFINLF